MLAGGKKPNLPLKTRRGNVSAPPFFFPSAPRGASPCRTRIRGPHLRLDLAPRFCVPHLHPVPSSHPSPLDPHPASQILPLHPHLTLGPSRGSAPDPHRAVPGCKLIAIKILPKAGSVPPSPSFQLIPSPIQAFLGSRCHMGARRSQTSPHRAGAGRFPPSSGAPSPPRVAARHICLPDVATRPGSASQMGDERRNPCTGFESRRFSLEIHISRLVARTPRLRGCCNIPVHGWARAAVLRGPTNPSPAPPSHICPLNPASAPHIPSSHTRLDPKSFFRVPNPASASWVPHPTSASPTPLPRPVPCTQQPSPAS